MDKITTYICKEGCWRKSTDKLAIALADEAIQAASQKELMQELSQRDGLHPAICGYGWVVNDIKKVDYLTINLSYEGLTRETVNELVRKYKELRFGNNIHPLGDIYKEEYEYHQKLKFYPKYMILEDDIVLEYHSESVLTTDPETIKLAKKYIVSLTKRAKKETVKELKTQLGALNTLWIDGLDKECKRDSFISLSWNYISNFYNLCHLTHKWHNTAKLLGKMYKKPKSSDLRKIYKKIATLDTELSNSVYYSYKNDKIKTDITDFVESLTKGYEYLGYGVYENEVFKPEHPKGVLMGIERIQKLLNKKAAV